MAGLATRSTESTFSIDSTTARPARIADHAAGIVGEAQVLRGVFRVPGHLLGQGMLGIEIEIAVEPVLLDANVLHDADAVAEAPPLAGIDVVDVDPHPFVHRRGLGDDRGRVFAALLGDGAQQLDALDEAALAIDPQGDAAVVGVFLEDVQGGCGGEYGAVAFEDGSGRARWRRVGSVAVMVSFRKDWRLACMLTGINVSL